MYLGNTEIAKAYLGNDLVFQKGGVQPVMIPYIRGGHNGSYINTGINPDSTTRVIVWARNFNPLGEFLFGARDAEMTQRFAVLHPGGADVDRIRVDFGSNNQTYVDAATTKYSSGYHKYELNGNQFYVDDVLLATCPSATFECAFPMFIFGYNAAGTRAGIPPYPIDICACKIYKNDILVRDYTAVNTPSAGLYDSVSQTLFTNAGNGSFTYGEFDRDAYTPLEYIECDGHQYFDSGAYGTYSGSIVAKFMPTNTTAKWTCLLGFRTSSNSCDIALGTSTSGQDNMRCYWRFGPNDTGGQAFSGSTTNKLTNKTVVAFKSNAKLTLYIDNTQVGTSEKSGVSSSFQTTYPMAVGAIRNGESSYKSGESFIGRIYYIGFASDRSFIPAKKGARVGMYDTYNDVFYSSATDTPFIAGPTI